MKKTTALVLALLMLSLSACSMLQNIKENAKRNAEKQILDTPADEVLLAGWDETVRNSFETCHKVSSHTSTDIGRPHVTGDADVSLLDAAAGIVKDLIADGAPGDETKDVGSISGTALEGYDPALALEVKTERNTIDEAVTGEDGKELTDEEGEVIREKKVSDNFLKATFCYYTVKEPSEGEEGEPAYVPADEALLISVFGEKRDKNEVLSHFDVVGRYFTDIDYTFTYLDPEVRCELDLDEKRLTSVEFNKIIRVTATAKCVGPLEKCGAVTVTFDLDEKTAYTFDYPVVE